MRNYTVNRNRLVYLGLAIATMLAGLASRRFANGLPEFIATYAGDTLWALFVFLLIAGLFPRRSPIWVALVTLAIAYTTEISQLYSADWIDAIRQNRLGGLILGFGFLWSDLVCYTVGIGIGVSLELIVYRRP